MIKITRDCLQIIEQSFGNNFVLEDVGLCKLFLPFVRITLMHRSDSSIPAQGISSNAACLPSRRRTMFINCFLWLRFLPRRRS